MHNIMYMRARAHNNNNKHVFEQILFEPQVINNKTGEEGEQQYGIFTIHTFLSAQTTGSVSGMHDLRARRAWRQGHRVRLRRHVRRVASHQVAQSRHAVLADDLGQRDHAAVLQPLLIGGLWRGREK